MNPRQVEQHIVILGWLFIVGQALFLVVGGLAFLLLAILALPGLAAGYGLLNRKPWARVLAIVVGILGLPNFPLGTAIGVYTCWVLLPTSSQAWFAPPRPTRA